MRACLSIRWERFRGSQKEDERGPLRILFLYSLSFTRFDSNCARSGAILQTLFPQLNIGDNGKFALLGAAAMLGKLNKG
jgi:hypothetical protein